eukprot:2559415-Rhodomonas_salina.1
MTNRMRKRTSFASSLSQITILSLLSANSNPTQRQIFFPPIICRNTADWAAGSTGTGRSSTGTWNRRSELSGSLLQQQQSFTTLQRFGGYQSWRSVPLIIKK